MFGVSKIFALFERKFFWTTKFVGGILYNSLGGGERIEAEQGPAHDGFVSKALERWACLQIDLLHGIRNRGMDVWQIYHRYPKPSQRKLFLAGCGVWQEKQLVLYGKSSFEAGNRTSTALLISNAVLVERFCIRWMIFNPIPPRENPYLLSLREQEALQLLVTKLYNEDFDNYQSCTINEQICKTAQKSSFHKPYTVFIRLTQRKM